CSYSFPLSRTSLPAITDAGNPRIRRIFCSAIGAFEGKVAEGLESPLRISGAEILEARGIGLRARATSAVPTPRLGGRTSRPQVASLKSTKARHMASSTRAQEQPNAGPIAFMKAFLVRSWPGETGERNGKCGRQMGVGDGSIQRIRRSLRCAPGSAEGKSSAGGEAYRADGAIGATTSTEPQRQCGGGRDRLIRGGGDG